MSKYQLNYASARPQMYDENSRVLRGKRIVRLLGLHFGKEKLKKLRALDVGSSTGIIDNEIAKSVGKMVGCDIDRKALKFAKRNFRRKNLFFRFGDAMKLDFPDASFDIVICAQVYEHVPNPGKMFAEIYRVLRPQGVCYLAALNKYWIIEPHYNLPFLSWLPKNTANLYVRIFGKAKNYYETPLSYQQLSKLAKRFQRIDYTEKILSDPEKYGYRNMPLPKLVSPILKYFAPTFFWLLVKP